MRTTIITNVLILGFASAFAQHKPAASQLSAGKYIVEHVSVCGNCHTPRDSKGAFLRHQTLMGGTLRFIRPLREGRWATDAPRLAGLPRWEDEEVVILLTTGTKETKITPRPPMPAFHMTRHDAEAVVAYLKSVNPNANP